MVCFWQRIIKYNIYQIWTSVADRGELVDLSLSFPLITGKNMGQIQKATLGELTRSQQQANWGRLLDLIKWIVILSSLRFTSHIKTNIL